MFNRIKILTLKNKKGLSSVVTTLIILLLALIALTITYATASNILYSIKYSPSLTCSDIKIENPIEIVSSCYNEKNGKIEIQLRRSFSSIEINELRFTLSSSLNSLDYSCGGLSCGCTILNQGEIRKYEFIPVSPQSYNQVIIKADDCVLKEKEISVCQN